MIKRDKLAVIFCGLSHLDKPKKEVSVNSTVSIDYKYCLESYNRYVLPGLCQLFNQIDNFIITYNNEKLQEIIEDFSPKDMMIIPHCQMLSRKADQYKLRMLDSCNLIQEYMNYHNETYDNILLLRFDYVYLQPLVFDKLDLDILNFGWHYKNHKCDQTDDGFILFTPNHIQDIVDHVNKNPYPHQLQFSFPKYGYLVTGINNQNRYYLIYRLYKKLGETN